MIDQSYWQCHFFGPQGKDKDMHRKKPQAERVYRIGEAARLLNLQTSVLRFWEGEFPMLQPVRTPKGQRLYSEQDMVLLRTIRSLLHEQGMTIEGARRVLSGGSVTAQVPASVPGGGEEKRSAGMETLLRDVARELQEVRAMLAGQTAEETHS